MGTRQGILIILDGWGENPDPKFNAVAQAKKPTWDKINQKYPHTVIEASEQFVGLPSGFMGNSEVGHLNIGAGRIVYQDFSLISKAISDQTFFSNPVFLGLSENLKKSGATGTLHLMGLVSDGGVHSHISHLYALIQWAKQQKIKKVMIHVMTDGRDTNPTSGLSYVRDLENFCRDAELGEIASVSGRFYAMDRDNRWERTEKAYRAIVGGKSESVFTQAQNSIEMSYERGITDEFILPTVRKGYPGILDGDGILFFNFRADRARQMVRALSQRDFNGFKRECFPALSGLVCMTTYDDKLGLPVAFEKPKVIHTLGEVISEMGGKQLRIAETEKYAHVTYFFNGGEEKPFENEKRILIPSNREVKTYDLKPEMSAVSITETLLQELKSNDYCFVVVNFANADMVGHTGNLSAAIKAVETIDICLKKIVDWVESTDGFAVITADHGNCEKMIDDQGEPLTSHTLLSVPFLLVDPKNVKGTLKKGGKLCDIAPTMLQVWGLNQPPEMTGHSLLA